ncbi:MAG: hypothetical protein ACTSWL_02080 [Promethearchaeota archaeon]
MQLKKIFKINWKIGLLVGILCFSFLSPAFGANIEWSVNSGDELIFKVDELKDDTVTLTGNCSLSVESIASSGLTYSLVPHFITDTGNKNSNFTASSVEETGLSISVLSDIVLLYSKTQMNINKTNADSNFEALQKGMDDKYSGNLNVEFTLKKLSYGYELKFEDFENHINTYTKIQYNSLGILLHYEQASLNVDGQETGLKITLLSYSGSTGGIPGYPLPILLGSMGISLLLVIRILKKKR